MNNDQYLCLRRNVIAVVIAFILVGGFLVLLGMLGYANVIETRIAGQGTMDQAFYTSDDSLAERAMAEGNFTYNSKRTWDAEVAGNKFNTEFILTSATGGYKNQYKIQDAAAKYGHLWRATKITNNFSTTSEIVTTATTLDSLIIMDGDNAEFRGRIINATTGKPLTEYEQEIVGKASIRQYLNITEPIKEPDDWLAFCNKIEEQLPEFKVTPVNMTIKEGENVAK